MKRRWMSLLLALCMIFSLFPVTEIQAATAKYYTVEKYDAEGNGTMLVPPTETTNWSGSFGTSFISSLLGSGNVRISNDQVTGMPDASQEDGWLDNGDLGENSRWYIATDDGREVYLDSSYFYARSVTVLRFIYVPNGDFSKAGMTTEGLGYGVDALMTVEKGDLIKTLSAYDGAVLGGNRRAAFDAGIATIVNINATAEEVAAAKTRMETATDSATGVELNKESTELYVGQKETLTATLTPGGSTDVLTWTSSDENIVTVEDGVLKAMNAGTAVVTVTAENPEVTDTINVTVQALQGLFVTKLNSNSSSTIAAQTGELLLTAFTEPDSLTNLDWQWSVEDPSVAEVIPTEGNEYLATVKGKKEGVTNVIVTLGSQSASFEVEVTPYDGPYVYFDYDDPDKEDQLLDENDTITLTCLDEGKFVVGRGNGTAYWSGGNAMVSSIAGGDDLQYWVFVGSENGKWNPWDVRELNMTVDCGGWYKSFTVKCVSSGITELKTYVGDQEVTIDAPYESEGKVSGVPVTVKGKNADGEWIDIPSQALHYATSDTSYSFRWIGNQFSMSTGGQATLSVFMKDNWSVKQQFIAKCNYVKLTGFTIETPETFTITGERDFMTGYYYGLGLYTDNLKITYTPGNATYTELEWEALTPDIAFYTAQHNAGIVPLRCGTAQFKVSSKDDPNLTQNVTVTFLYQKPLVSAALDKTEYELEVGDSEALNITVTPADATEQGFTYSYSEEGIAEIKDGEIIAKNAGTVTVTAVPLDTTQGCPSLTFTVKVRGSLVEQDDPMPLVTSGIAHGLAYLENQSVSRYGNEWTIFTILRAGGSISDEDKAAYLESVTAKVTEGLSQPTDYARVILTLGVMGEDPTDFAGVNLVEQLYNRTGINRMTSNMISWTLLALDSKNYEVPEDAVNTREKLIDWLLAFQTEDGGFCLSGSSTSVDMTGMILQALAPYNNENYPAVQTAFSKAVTWMKAQMSLTAGFADTSAYSENSCTTAQVLTALAAAGIDAVDPDNGFTIAKNNMVTNLYGYKADTGFFWDPTVGTSGDLMGTQQTTYALEAYRRFAAGENALYDLTDVSVNEQSHEHSFSEWTVVTEATCTAEGVRERICECGEKETESIAKLAHTYGSWKVTKQATMSTTGTKVRTCSVCGHKETAVIAKLPQKSGVEGYVTRLYNLVLDRNPDKAGLNDWVDRLNSGKTTGADAAYGFIFSKEYQKKNTSNESYVEMLYQTILGRKADAAGKADWVEQLNNGVSRLGVLAGFTGSVEFTKICAKYGIIRGNLTSPYAVDVNPKVTAFAARMYTKVLGRSYDPKGLEDWTAKLINREIGGGQLSDGFFHSQEFLKKNVSDKEFLNICYRTYLGREADKAGFDYWMSRMAAGLTRDELRKGFIGSQEYGKLCQEYGIDR